MGRGWCSLAAAPGTQGTRNLSRAAPVLLRRGSGRGRGRGPSKAGKAQQGPTRPGLTHAMALFIPWCPLSCVPWAHGMPTNPAPRRRALLWCTFASQDMIEAFSARLLGVGSTLVIYACRERLHLVQLGFPLRATLARPSSPGLLRRRNLSTWGILALTPRPCLISPTQ